MSIFTPDTSIQITGDSTLSKTYNTKDNPNLAFHSRAGIYNSADNTIKIFTNNVDALTIDANQKVICNGSLITNLTWGNIDGKPSFFDGTWGSLSGKPTNFQSDWNSTVINKPTLFDGTWTSLSGKPTNFQSDWNSTVINKPTLFDGTWTSLSGKPTNFQSDWDTTIINKPTLFDGTWTSLSGKPTFATVATSGSYNDLSGKPDLTLKQDVISVSNPITKTGNTIGLSYDSTLTLNGNQLSVASGGSLASKWTTSGTNIYNNNTGNVGINVSAPQQKLSVDGSIESTNANGDKLYFSYNNANGYRHRIYTHHDSGTGDNNYIQFYNWRYGQTSTTVGDRSVVIFHNKYTRFDGNRYFWINDITVDRGNKTYTDTPLSIFNQTPSSSTVLNDPLPVLNLARQGTSAQTYGQNACFKICRWENSSTNSRTRLDIDLSDNGNDDFNIMTLRSDKRVGINTTIPVSRFTIRGDYSVLDNNFCLDATDTAGVNNKYNLKIYPYVIGGGQVGYKIRVISNTTNITDALTFSDVGNVCIGDITPSYKFQIKNGSVFLGDIAYVSTGLATANGYKLIFDSTYNGTAGSGNICNKILLHNTSSFNAGFGIESGALVYQSGDSHSFYTGTTASAYGTRRMLLSSTGNLNINTNNNTYVKLQVNGVVNFHAGGTPYAALNNNMIAGSLCIGDRTYDYGGGSGWNTNVAGLLLECLNNTEIAIHDNGERVNSLIYFAGGGNNYHEYGRNMGWGHPNGHYFKCNNVFECYFANGSASWNYFKVEPTSLWGDGLSTANDQNGTKYLTMRNLMFQNPHIVPHTVGGNAHIRMGRAGGVASGHFWDVATRTDGRFHIVRNGNVFSSSMVIKPNGNVSFANENSYDDPTAPTLYQFLHLGNSTTANVCDWNLVIHKSNGSGGTRHFAMGYDSSFYETIGDNGGNNIGSGNWLSHLSMSYAAPDYSLQLFTNGNFQVYGTISSSSDIKIKKNVRTIDNALWKVQQLRGVYYTHVIEGTKNIGLIAQEVEGIIPEVVSYNERTDMKGVNYANLTSLLINAIKEQQEIIEAQNDRINKIEEILYNLINKE